MSASLLASVPSISFLSSTQIGSRSAVEEPCHGLMCFIPQKFMFWELGPWCGGVEVVGGDFKRWGLVGGSSVIEAPLS